MHALYIMYFIITMYAACTLNLECVRKLGRDAENSGPSTHERLVNIYGL